MQFYDVKEMLSQMLLTTKTGICNNIGKHLENPQETLLLQSIWH